MIEQTVFYVNCASCGEIIEVVNPRLDVTPRKVLAGLGADVNTPYAVSEITMMSCPKCKGGLRIYWWFH